MEIEVEGSTRDPAQPGGVPVRIDRSPGRSESRPVRLVSEESPTFVSVNLFRRDEFGTPLGIRRE